MTIQSSAVDPSLSLHKAVRALYQKMKVAIRDPDPAPWLVVSNEQALERGGDNPETYVRNLKLYHRTKLVLARALLSGAIQSYFEFGSDENDPIPAWAWQNPDCTKHVWWEGRLPFDILLPWEWRRFSSSTPYVDRTMFDAWLASGCPLELNGLPDLPLPIDLADKPQVETNRGLPDIPYVTLSEALSWIAYKFAISQADLSQAIEVGSFGEVSAVQYALIDAAKLLLSRATGGQITMRGKYVNGREGDRDDVLTQKISPVRFVDFAQFDILYDGLTYGNGLTWIAGGSAVDRAFQSRRRDAYRSVTVNRSELLLYFPASDFAAAPISLPMLPATLTDIGPIMGLDEALCWAAYDRPSGDIQIWESAAGDITKTDYQGAPLRGGGDNQPSDSILRYLEASRSIWRALRDGTLASYIAPHGSPTLAVPRLSWDSQHPEHLNRCFPLLGDADVTTSYPVLLARGAFNEWRSQNVMNRTSLSSHRPGNERPSHSQIVTWCRDWISAGRGNGMDRAWPDFQAIAAHAGLSRDDAFRPAWNEAKRTHN